MKILARFVPLALVLAATPARALDEDDDNFRADVFLCEEAIGKLVSCCPAFRPEAIECTYLEQATTGCDFHTTITETPALGEAEAKCVLASGCEALRAGVCARAQVATSYVDVSRDSSIDSPAAWREPRRHDPVCP